MLAAIAFAVAEPVGEDEGLAVLLEGLGVISRRRMDRHDEEAELHEFLRRRGTTASNKVMRSRGEVNSAPCSKLQSRDDKLAPCAFLPRRIGVYRSPLTAAMYLPRVLLLIAAS